MCCDFEMMLRCPGLLVIQGETKNLVKRIVLLITGLKASIVSVYHTAAALISGAVH